MTESSRVLVDGTDHFLPSMASVVYFDQGTGASHAVRWSKSWMSNTIDWEYSSNLSLMSILKLRRKTESG